MTTVLDFSAVDIAGQEKRLADFEGKVLAIVNTASKCGFTPQFEALEDLYQTYKKDGFEVLGFPCNQFGAQEPGGEAEIASFCSTTYGVTFPMFGKVKVNGPDAHPLYKFIKKEKPGFAGSTGIKWNFTKFLVDRTGRVFRRYAPQERPQSMRRDIEKLLAA
ncbi:MAG: glutathione peroxidase [Pseudomonadota bacterium]